MNPQFIIYIVLIVLTTISCNKENSKFCTNQIIDNSKTIILSQEELNIIKSLFDNNHLDNSNYQFHQLLTEESGHHHVKCHQFYNNLKIFTDDLIFHFDSDGKYYFLSGSILSKINLDTKSNIQPVNLIKMYLNERNKDGIYYNPKDSCFDMEFGYYDLNAGISYASQNITKAWKIKPLNKDFPFAFINDLTSEIIYYDNGFRD